MCRCEFIGTTNIQQKGGLSGVKSVLKVTGENLFDLRR